MMNVFITGSSKGLGKAFSEHFLEEYTNVYGLGRTPSTDAITGYLQVDIANTTALHSALHRVMDGVDVLDLVILNAGTLGRIQDMSQCSLEQLKSEMDVNMWANKTILDFFIQNRIVVKQVIAISSGASVNGSLGWNGYSLSKAALNMLIKLYAAEMKETHLCALAPGLVKTEMLEGILDGDHDTTRYSSVQALRESDDAGMVLSPKATVARIMAVMPKVLKSESGAFLDVRMLE